MAKVKMKAAFGGTIGNVADPRIGDVVETSDEEAQRLIDGGHAEPVTAAKKTAAKKTTKRGTKTAETAEKTSDAESR